MTTVRIEGGRIDSIAAFYDEINRVFMADEDWRLGQSLDALDDLLYGGFGTLAGSGPARVEWVDHRRSAAALGVDATRAWHLARLSRPDVYRTGPIRDALAALDAGSGETYFDIVLRVFADHPDIDLVLL